MLDYQQVVKQLKEKDEQFIEKLSIYQEMSLYPVELDEVSVKDVNEVVDYLHNIYIHNGVNSVVCSVVVTTALELCDYDIKEVQRCIRDYSEWLEDRISDMIDKYESLI